MGYLLAIAFFGVSAVSAYLGYRKGAGLQRQVYAKYEALKTGIEGGLTHYSVEVRGFASRLKQLL